MNKDELIHRIAHSMDPPVFEREGSQPPQGFGEMMRMSSEVRLSLKR